MKTIAGPDARQPGGVCDNGCIDNAACSDELCTCNAGFRLDRSGECGKKVKDLHHLCNYVARTLQQESGILNYGITIVIILFFMCYT